MGGAMSRNKGAAAEREVFKQIGEALDIKIERNLVQSRSGGADCQQPVGHFAVEVKRQEQLDLKAWWKQACVQADAAGSLPMLIYRQSRHPWRGQVAASVFCSLWEPASVAFPGHFAEACAEIARLPAGVVDLDFDLCIQVLRRSIDIYGRPDVP